MSKKHTAWFVTTLVPYWDLNWITLKGHISTILSSFKITDAHCTIFSNFYITSGLYALFPFRRFLLAFYNYGLNTILFIFSHQYTLTRGCGSTWCSSPEGTLKTIFNISENLSLLTLGSNLLEMLTFNTLSNNRVCKIWGPSSGG